MSIRVFVPQDSAACSVGAHAVAAAIVSEANARGIAIDLIRNGSRGLFWLEPLVEVETPQGRVAFGPVAPKDVPSLFEAGFLSGAAHPLALGPTEEIPYLASARGVLGSPGGSGPPPVHALSGFGHPLRRPGVIS